MSSEDIRIEPPGPASLEEESEAARKIVAGLILARKHFSLYPEDHTICMNALDQLQRAMGSYLDVHETLRLEVENDRILSGGEIMVTDRHEEGTLSFILFRDGIRWLEFLKGIDVGELKEILHIINQYSMLSDKTDGDIVTAFWEKRFPHLKYEVADFSWGAAHDAAMRHSPATGRSPLIIHENILAGWTPGDGLPFDPEEIELSSVDQFQIQEMICVEEDRSPTAYLDILLDCLMQYREEGNFRAILAVLEDEMSAFISTGDFGGVLGVLQGLQQVLQACKADMTENGVKSIENFYGSFSASKSLARLKEVWARLDPGQSEKAGQIFQFLRSGALPILGALLNEGGTAQQQQMLIEAIVSLARRDMHALETLLKGSDERLVQRLVRIFSGMPGEQAQKLLMDLLHHPSERVRQEAIKGVFQRESPHMREVYSLIDDKDKSVRLLIFRNMARSRNKSAESFLLNYIEHKLTLNADNDHITACFSTLGQCGSSRSVPFLRRTLFNRAWIPDFGKASLLREGAVLALSRIGTNDARKVLDEAERSMYPAVRQALRKQHRS